jgi:outer membrane lipoprotein
MRISSPQAAGLALCLAGCASQVPEDIRRAASPSLTIAQVQEAPAALQGRRVRWGGRIVATINLPTTTEIEVLSRPLSRDGRPRENTDGDGRFIARIAGFADPMEYAKDRELTVEGPVVGVQTRKVGDYPYAYPVVAAETRYLWPEAPSPLAYPYPIPWGWPGYGPWGWPYGPGIGPWWGPW